MPSTEVARVQARYSGASVVDGEGTLARIGARLDLPMTASLLSGLHRSPEGEGTCPACGWTDAEHLNSSRVGCPLCYSSLSTVSTAVFPTFSPQPKE